MKMLDRPAVVNELMGKPIQQIRMRRSSPVHSKITGRVDEPASKMVLPDSVHDHAGRQGIVLSNDPLCQGDSPLLLRLVQCGLVGMGATDHHYLAVDTQLRPVLAWFGAHLVPGAVYLQSSQFQDGRLSDSRAISELETLVDAVITMQQAVAKTDGFAGPSPLAAG